MGPKQHQKPAAAAPVAPELQRAVPVPDAEGRSIPVLAANAVRVMGGIDSLLIDFYFLDMSQLGLVFSDQSHAKSIAGMRILPDGVLLVDARPIARLSLPANVVIDLVVQSAAIIAESIPRLAIQLSDAGKALGNLGPQFQAAMSKMGAS